MSKELLEVALGNAVGTGLDNCRNEYPDSEFASETDIRQIRNEKRAMDIKLMMNNRPHELWSHHELASVAEFNAYRIDLDIAMVVYRGSIIIYSDGSPKYFLTGGELRELITTDTLHIVAKEIDNTPLFWTCKRNAECVLYFLYRSLQDRLAEEKKADDTGETAFYVAFRKERDPSGCVETKMWFDSYDPHRVSEWQHTAPLLNIDNHVFKPSQTNIFNDRGSKGFFIATKKTIRSE